MSTTTIENKYVGDGSTILYSFTFPYIDTADIKVSLDEVDTTEYTLANATTVEFNTAPVDGVAIRIYRKTSVEDPKAIFFPGSAIRAQDLNNNFEQSLFVVQEASFNNSQSAADSAAALTTAQAADVKSDQANVQSAAAEASAATANTNATQAAADAAQAQADATQAATAASAAQVSADQANSAVQAAAIFTPVPNVAAIPGSPTDQDRVSVLDSTGIASFAPLTGLPVGPTYDSGSFVNLVYQQAQTTWAYVTYGANDPDARYLLDQADTVSSTNIASSAVTTAKIINLGVTTDKLADTSVTTDKLASSSVTTDKIASAAVTPSVLDRPYLETAGGTMTGDLTALKLNMQAGGTATVAGDYLLILPVGVPGTGMSTGTGVQDGAYFVGPSETNTNRPGSMVSQISTQAGANLALTRKAPSTTGARYIDFWYQGSNSGSITLQTSTSVRYNTTSDYRLKENVVPIVGASSKLKQLKPYGYNFISNPEIPMLGFLAHEVAEVLPAVVSGEKDAVDEEGRLSPQQMDYSLLTPILTAALQEALARIETLEAKVQTLETN